MSRKTDEPNPALNVKEKIESMKKNTVKVLVDGIGFIMIRKNLLFLLGNSKYPTPIINSLLAVTDKADIKISSENAIAVMNETYNILRRLIVFPAPDLLNDLFEMWEPKYAVELMNTYCYVINSSQDTDADSNEIKADVQEQVTAAKNS